MIILGVFIVSIIVAGLVYYITEKLNNIFDMLELDIRTDILKSASYHIDRGEASIEDKSFLYDKYLSYLYITNTQDPVLDDAMEQLFELPDSRY